MDGEFVQNNETTMSSQRSLAAEFLERFLQQDSDEFNQTESNHTEFNYTVAPSDMGTTSTPMPTALPTLRAFTFYPTLTPTILFSQSSFTRILLSVDGACNGCGNELFTTNQVISGRRLNYNAASVAAKIAATSPSRPTRRSFTTRNGYTRLGRGHRMAQEEERAAATSNCFCPLTAVVNDDPPSVDRVSETLQTKLEEEDVDVRVDRLNSVVGVACDDVTETRNFKSDFVFRFSAMSDVDDKEIEFFGEVLAEVYNMYIEDFCDPLIRRDIRLELEDRQRVFTTR